LTILVWFAFGTRAHALADNRRPTPWGWQCSRCPYGHPGAFRVASRLRRLGPIRNMAVQKRSYRHAGAFEARDSQAGKAPLRHRD
jgi:hypothetical protein